MPRVPFLLALVCVPLLAGCDGCRRDSDRQSGEEQEQVPLQDFTARRAEAFPGDANLAAGGIKPGHWMTASQSLKSNKVDARGELHSHASASAAIFATGSVEATQGNIPSVRPVVLPKGQQRRFDYRLLAPILGDHSNKRAFLSSRFLSAGRSVFYDTGKQPLNVLAGHEYFFVILTNRPERFAKFQVSDWVRPYRDEYAFKDSFPNYRIVFPPTTGVLPLSETMLDWTGTAVVCWDDLPADALTPGQQQAMADWVRFGGQLIVNGAAASDAISRTAMADLLPLRPTGNIELDADSGVELLKGWAVPTDPSTEKQIAMLRSQSGRVAVDGRTAADTVALANSGSLVLVRRVGNGRVVQPRFDLTSDWMVSWQSYDSFINAAILARPRREFALSDDASEESFIKQLYADHDAIAEDPALNTRFRITARDAVLPGATAGGSLATSRLDPLTAIRSSTGIAGWTDNSDAMRLCRDILKSESGIEIPDSSLVVRSLGYYLLILVPINYLFFRFLGRLEYAWLAVPLIAVGGAAWVARAARLDIGFARKHTELALLEMQPNYDRGHLSRVVAIYNSLSSSYDIQFDSTDGVAAPISGEQAVEQPIFKTSFAEGPILSGVSVGSNKTRLVHVEQLVDVGGAITLDAQTNLVNETSYELFDAVVVEKNDRGVVRVAMVGPCQSGSTVKLRYLDMAIPAVDDTLPMQSVRMIRRFASANAMPNGSARLVGRIDASMPGMSITPDTKQAVAQTIVLAHLTHAPIPTPKIDANLVQDVQEQLRRGGDSQSKDSQ